MRAYQTLAAYLAARPGGKRRTQRPLAKKLGITQSALSMIAARKRTPRPDLQMKIHEITKVPLSALTRKDDPKDKK